ncbi:MAG: HAD-IIIA family hydrolase [Candidatus Eremiobacteraeota bacterium]|nr:HAD-IIIA family hydrolase [Candidatus Eremiobacteraeota bacterium]
MSESRPVLFLDRDGILVEVVRRGSVISSARSWEEFCLVAGAAELVSQWRQLGFFTVLVTNQPDVARGFLCPQLLEDFHRELLRQIPLDAVEVCVEDGCHWRRKPNPGMLLDAAANWNLDLSRGILLGDRQSDVLAARAAGVRPVLLSKDYNLQEVAESGELTVIQRLDQLTGLLQSTISSVGHNPLGG